MTETPSHGPGTTTAAPAPSSYRRRPALEGLEEKWVGALEGRRDLRLRPDPAARERLLDRHSAADGARHRCTSGTSSPTPTPTWSRASSGCRASRCSTRWAGTTTACRPSAGCRTTSASAATPRCPTTRTSPRRRSPTPSGRSRSAGPTSSSCASSSSSEDEKVFEDAVAHARPVGRLVPALHDDRAQGAEGQPARVPAQLRPRRGLPPGGADPLGRHLPDRGRAGRARGPRVRRRTTTASPSTGRDGDRIHIETTRPELIPSVVALIAHPDDERYQPPVRHHRDLAGLRRRDPGARPPGGRARQGRRHRDVLHLRRPHRRHVVARAAAAGPHADRPRRPAARARPPSGSRAGRPRRRTRSSRARPRSAPARRWSPSCASPATSTASRSRPSGWRTSTRRATSRSRSSPPASGTSRNGGRDAELRAEMLARGARDHLDPRRT